VSVHFDAKSVITHADRKVDLTSRGCYPQVNMRPKNGGIHSPKLVDSFRNSLHGMAVSLHDLPAELDCHAKDCVGKQTQPTADGWHDAPSTKLHAVPKAALAGGSAQDAPKGERMSGGDCESVKIRSCKRYIPSFPFFESRICRLVAARQRHVSPIDEVWEALTTR
jgi:hypothetical protein